MKKELPNLIVKVADKAQSNRAQIAFFALGYRWVGDMPKSFYLEGDSGFISTDAGLMYDDEQGGETEVTISALEALANKFSEPQTPIIEVTGEVGNLPDLTSEQAAAQIAVTCLRCDANTVKSAFQKVFTKEPLLARLISQAVANWEGTKAVTPQSNAFQIPFDDRFLDGFKDSETEFYK